MVNVNRDLTLLLHMLKYTKEITDLNLIKITFDDFKSNYVIRNSVSMDIMQIGELSTHLSEEYVSKSSKEINWKAIRGMRNRFAHGYFTMDYKIIYETALNDIPELQQFLIKEIENNKL